MDREFIFRSNDLPQTSFKFFVQAKQRQKFCDVKVNFGNRVITAHRVILTAAIPAFQETSDFEEEIQVPNIDPNVLESLINYAYSCELKITMENVKAILLGATSLRMKDVQSACCDFLTQRLQPDNVLEFRDLADDLNLQEFKELIDLFVRENFGEVSKTWEFLNSPFTYVIELLSKDDLNVDKEEKVLESALNWVKVSVSERKSYLTELLRQVRMVLLSPLYLTDVVDREELIRTSLENRDLVDEARAYNLFPERRKTTCSFSTKPREFVKISNDTRETDRIIYSVNLIMEYTVLCLDMIKKEWHTKIIDPTWVDNASIAVLNKKMYFFYSSYLLEYDPESNKCSATEHMTVPRYTAAAVSLKDKIYVCGGYNTDFTSSKAVECFDPCNKSWTEVNPLVTGRRGLEAVSLADYIYVLGGRGERSIYNTVERYSSVTGKWNYVASMIIQRYNSGAAVLNGRIYICGGCTNVGGTEFTATAEVYNPITNEWKLISSMNIARSLKASVAFHGKLYTIGGKNLHEISLHQCEVYDPLYDMWTNGPAIPSSHHCSGAAII